MVYVFGGAGLIGSGRRWWLTAIACCSIGLARPVVAQPPQGPRTVADAIRAARDYLCQQERTWRNENRCFSCHNQGLALRAAWVTEEPSARVPLNEETRRWLSDPDQWRIAPPPANALDVDPDQSLADLHFARTYLLAIQQGRLQADNSALRSVGQRLTAHLVNGQHWPADASSALPSPLSCGPMLGTWLVCQWLRQSDELYWRPQIQSCENWLLDQVPRSLPDAAVQLWAVARHWPQHREVGERALAMITEGQQASGGWGPYSQSPPEPFDTALVLLALCHLRTADCMPQTSWNRTIARGLQFLLESQEPTGGWPATTRPPRRDSYAQHIATTAWVLEALWLSQLNPNR